MNEDTKINYEPSDRQLYGREGAENIQLYKMLQSQRTALNEYEVELNIYKQKLYEAKALLARIINPESRPPDPWYDILSDITEFLRENE
jgi:hypothetical protein